ncbi:MAG: NAD(+) synthase [Coprobacter sp.]|nr:NAD(+) synthase [Coprobacter sp.]
MKYGFIKVATAIPDCRVGDCNYNSDQIIELLHRADEQKAEIVVFPELCITGYSCGDLFGQRLLLEAAEKSIRKVVESTRSTQVLAIIGAPLAQSNKVFNVAIIIGHGRIYGIVPKTHLPNYKEFYEKRWFCSAMDMTNDTIDCCGESVPFGTQILFTSGNTKIAVELCEDLWVTIPPSSYHAQNGANIIVNLSASNDLAGKHDYLRTLVSQQSARTTSAYLYVSAGLGESSTDLVFGGKGIIAESGTILAEGKRFCDEPQIIITEIDIERLLNARRSNTAAGSKISEYRYIPVPLPNYTDSDLTRRVDSHPFIPSDNSLLNERCEEIFNIQVSGLVKRLRHTGAQSAVIGISGGLDSTLALLVTVRAFDRLGLSRDKITGITMPGFGTTDRTYNNALDLMRSLGVSIREISIKNACIQHFNDIGHDLNTHDVTYENSQARERTQILMDVANQTGGLVVGTGDLSELALGWATYNGDHMSMYGVNGSVPKTLVRHLVCWIASHEQNETTRATLLDVVDTPISPELIPADEQGNIKQKTEDLVGPYELHDFFLYHFIRHGFSPEKIYFLAQKAFGETYDQATIKHWLTTFFRRFFNQQFKRSCLPDGPKVGSVSLSPRGDWRMPSDASSALWLQACEAL